MVTEAQKPDEHSVPQQTAEPAELAPGETPAGEPVDLVDAFADDELISYEPRRSRPVADQDR